MKGNKCVFRTVTHRHTKKRVVLLKYGAVTFNNAEPGPPLFNGVLMSPLIMEQACVRGCGMTVGRDHLLSYYTHTSPVKVSDDTKDFIS